MINKLAKIRDLNGLIEYFAEELHWNIDLSYFDDVEDITYEFDAEDLGLKEEAFAKISSLRQLPPLVDGQPWGIFAVDFESKKFEVTALRKVLSGLIPKKRNSADHAVWNQQDLMFLCFWGEAENRTIGIAHFKEREYGLSQIKIISCATAIEGEHQLELFESRLSGLVWPNDMSDLDQWRSDWARVFISGYREVIKDTATLTKHLADAAAEIRDTIMKVFEVETSNGYVHLLHKKFKDTLVHDMDEKVFADMYAQTIVYGLFSARCMDTSQDDFSVEEAIDCIPNTNPFLKELMRECLTSNKYEYLSFDELGIGNVIELLRNTETTVIAQDFNRLTGEGKEDPVIHFYERFLEEYDKDQKMERGVFYTPQPIVDFIIKSVDTIIKNKFGLSNGLASTKQKEISVKRRSKRKNSNGLYTTVDEKINVPAIQILDPALGTGTFLRQAILQIYKNFREAYSAYSENAIQETWNKYVSEQLLKRINGFEIMMAPYAVAHMKLAMVLKDTGYDFSANERLKVYLTNTLEEPGNTELQFTLFDDPLAYESIEANRAKSDKGINIIIGNPPYRGVSSNNNSWISDLIEEYKYIEGKHFKERKHWLNNDYVKFIRYAEHIIEKNGKGIVAYITDNSFLQNTTFRGMREHLLKTFDDIYICDLHGSTKKDKAVHGSSDESVFGITQGVAIIIFIKNSLYSTEHANVYCHDIYGSRNDKFSALRKLELSDFNKVEMVSPYYVFRQKVDLDEEDIMTDGVVTDGFDVNELFPVNSTGYLSGSDKVLVGDSVEDVKKKVLDKHSKEISNTMIRKICYRPFDDKCAYFAPRELFRTPIIKTPACYRPRYNVMQHFNNDNVSLLVGRQGSVVGDIEWNLAFICKMIPDLNIFYRGGEAVYPLWIYEDSLNGAYRRPNFNVNIIDEFYKKTNLKCVNSRNQEDIHEYEPIHLVDYIYAVLHSRIYRRANAESLNQNYPIIPYPKTAEQFWQYVNFGEQLRTLHLSYDSDFASDVYFEFEGDNLVEKILYKDDKIYINKSQYFGNVSESIWKFYIGGYQILNKWLKDKKNRKLTNTDIENYKKVISIIAHTIELMEEINDFEVGIIN